MPPQPWGGVETTTIDGTEFEVVTKRHESGATEHLAVLGGAATFPGSVYYQGYGCHAYRNYLVQVEEP